MDSFSTVDNILALAFAAVAAVASVFAAALTFLCRRDYVRDATRPYRFAVFDNRAAITMLFINTRPSGVVILEAALDVYGDGKTVIPDAFVFDEIHFTPQSVPGWAYMRFFIKRGIIGKGTGHRVSVNVNSRIVFSLSNGETPKSPAGFLAKVVDLAAARKPEDRLQPTVVCAE